MLRILDDRTERFVLTPTARGTVLKTDGAANHRVGFDTSVLRQKVSH